MSGMVFLQEVVEGTEGNGWSAMFLHRACPGAKENHWDFNKTTEDTEGAEEGELRMRTTNGHE